MHFLGAKYAKNAYVAWAPGSAPDPSWGAYSTPSDRPGFKGPSSKAVLSNLRPDAARGGILCGPPRPMKILGSEVQFNAHFS